MRWVFLAFVFWWLANAVITSGVQIADIKRINDDIYQLVDIKNLSQVDFTVVGTSDVQRCPVGYEHIQWCNDNGKVCKNGHEMTITLDFSGVKICCIAVYSRRLAGFVIESSSTCGGDEKGNGNND